MITRGLKEKIAKLPDAPGVYLMKDAAGRIIYIGKAKSLKKRVQSYFNRPLDAKTQALVSKIADLEYRLASSESQAQIQEAALIKSNQPRYNIDLKDDKSFPWIRVSAEEFPRVSMTRKKRMPGDDRSLYFGPYTDARPARQALKLIRRIFGFCSCKKFPAKPCLYWRLKLCPAPCARKISRVDYQALVRRIKLFLTSKYEELIKDLGLRMREAAAARNFEEAARIRDQIGALSALTQGQAGPGSIGELEGLKNFLGLKALPLRIEAFDISNITGKEACGAMVSFLNALPDKDNYRKFRIKAVFAIDDYGMLREVVRRRYRRLREEKLPLPDLILIDGGKAHLLAAQDELKKLNLDIPLVSIAKEKENVYVKNRRQPLRFGSDTPALNLIRRVRDEAHRFAIKYHHLLHRKKIIGR